MSILSGEKPHFDPKKIREAAAKDIDQGAVTTDYPLDAAKTCKLLNDALASEILCVLRYRHHEFIAKTMNGPKAAEEFREHAESEEEHVRWIAERINQLGGDPDMNPRSVAEKAITEYGSATDLIGMIREDLVAERVVISLYRKMIQYFGDKDSTSRRIMEKILRDEEEHASDLADLLAEEGRQGSSKRDVA